MPAIPKSNITTGNTIRIPFRIMARILLLLPDAVRRPASIPINLPTYYTLLFGTDPKNPFLRQQSGKVVETQLAACRREVLSALSRMCHTHEHEPTIQNR